MIDGQIATLPIQPNDPWFRFVETLDAMPFKQMVGKNYKELPANSMIFRKGITISVTLDSELFILRAAFDASSSFLVGPELTGECRKYGWSYHTKAPDSRLFRREVHQEGESQNIAAQFIPILAILGVDPNQDWGI